MVDHLEQQGAVLLAKLSTGALAKGGGFAGEEHSDLHNQAPVIPPIVHKQFLYSRLHVRDLGTYHQRQTESLGPWNGAVALVPASAFRRPGARRALRVRPAFIC